MPRRPGDGDADGHIENLEAASTQPTTAGLECEPEKGRHLWILCCPPFVHFLSDVSLKKEDVMDEQDWLALGVTLFVMGTIGLILFLGLTGIFAQWY